MVGRSVATLLHCGRCVGRSLRQNPPCTLCPSAGVGRGRGQRVGAVRVPVGVDEGRAAGGDAADPRGCGGEGAQRAGEVMHVMPRRHVAGVACFQLVVQALRQLILGSGGDYLHACFYARILTCSAKENAILLGCT